MTEEIKPMLSTSDVARLLNVDRKTIANMVSDGRFPEPINLASEGTKALYRWSQDTVEKWMRTGATK